MVDGLVHGNEAGTSCPGLRWVTQASSTMHWRKFPRKVIKVLRFNSDGSVVNKAKCFGGFAFSMQRRRGKMMGCL